MMPLDFSRFLILHQPAFLKNQAGAKFRLDHVPESWDGNGAILEFLSRQLTQSVSGGFSFVSRFWGEALRVHAHKRAARLGGGTMKATS